MSEHDTFDLDRAFETLTNDISGASRAPGARNAITRARRRRTTLASVAAVAVLAVAAAAFQLNTADRSAQPIHGVDASLPAPQVFDAAALTTATDGWTSPWSATTPNSRLARSLGSSRCLNAIDAASTNAQPQSTGDLFLTTPEKAVAFGALADYKSKANRAATTWNALTSGIDACAGTTATAERTWDQGEARSWSLATQTASGQGPHLWLAREGNTVGILMMADTPGSVPGPVEAKVMTALVAGLQSKDSYTSSTRDPASASSSSSASAVSTVSEGDFAQALGTWQSGWRRDSGPKVDTLTPPCLSDSSLNGANSGQGAGLGANGSMEIDTFASPASAATSYQQLGGQLAACNSAHWTVRQVGRTGAAPVTVATSSAQGGLVTWIVQSGSAIGYIAIGGNVSTNPPDAVSGAVGDAILKALKPVS
ncbi:MAG: hypothetical protein ACR2K3_07735 [Nocardioides sp.]